MKSKLFLASYLIFLLCRISALAETTPGTQISKGGELKSVTIPSDIEVFKNLPNQKYLFDIDIGGDGEVVAVEILDGGKGAFSENGKTLTGIIKSWKFSTLIINDVKVDRWGVYFSLELVYNEKSGKCTLLAARGNNPIFSFVIPDCEIRELSKDELEIHRQRNTTNTPSFEGNNLFPPRID